MISNFNLSDLIEPRPRQLERYAEDYRRLVDEHREVTALQAILARFHDTTLEVGPTLD
jgi:hypothetical protein